MTSVLCAAFAFLPLSAHGADGDALSYGLADEIPKLVSYDGYLSTQTRAIVMDLATGCIILEQNGDVRAFPASTTKVMTALLLVENTADGDWDTPIAPIEEFGYSKEGSNSQMGLIVGDCPTRRDLLYGIMLPSGCDAAYVSACLVSGSENDFVDLMNVRASELGMFNTGYENPYGVAGTGHFTCAADMATLVRYAMGYDIFRAAASTQSYSFSIHNGTRVRNFICANTNYLIRQGSRYYYQYAIGVKTGTTGLADHCLTSAAKKDGLELICIVMNTDDNTERFTFSRELLEWGFNSYAEDGGLYSRGATNAYFKTSADECALRSAPNDDGELIASLPSGYGVRVGGYHYDENDDMWYLVWYDGVFAWTRASKLHFVCYVDDIEIENGSALCGCREVGVDDVINGTVSSRHTISTVTVTLYDSNGYAVQGATNYPECVGTHHIADTTIDMDIDLSILPKGEYTCVTQVTAIAEIPGCGREAVTSTVSSCFYVGDEPCCCVSYNPLGGTTLIDGAFVYENTYTISDITPQRAGCEFVGWNTAADGSGTSYNSGDVITVEASTEGNESITLYGVWQKAKSAWTTDCEICPAYCAEIGDELLDGTVSNPAIIDCITVEIEGEDGSIISNEYRVGVNEFDFSNANADFIAAELLPARYTVSVYGTVCSGDTVRELIWQGEMSVWRSEYTLEFELDGGYFEGDYSGFVVQSGKHFDNLPTPVKEGCEFVGWFDDTGAEIDESTVIPPCENPSASIYAHWLELPASTTEPSVNTGETKLVIWIWTIIGGVGAIAMTAVIIAVVRTRKRKKSKEQ